MDMAIAKQVYESRFGILDGHPLSLVEVSEKFNISREEARQMETVYLRTLHPVQKSRKLRDYLD